MREVDEKADRYEDIIHLPHHVSTVHPQMSMPERAAQFSPFAALSGHSDAIRETARLTDEFFDMDEGEKEVLDRRLAFLMEHLPEKPEITILVFLPDERKDGGSYRTVTGTVKKVDTFSHRLILDGGPVLPMEYIVRMDGKIFGGGPDD